MIGGLLLVFDCKEYEPDLCVPEFKGCCEICCLVYVGYTYPQKMLDTIILQIIHSGAFDERIRMGSGRLSRRRVHIISTGST